MQVAAASGHKVTVVDQSQEIIDKASASIQKSLGRVVKKKFPDDSKVSYLCLTTLKNWKDFQMITVPL